MSGEYFLDTTVFIYQFDDRDPEKCKTAETLILNNLKNKTGIISFQVIQELANTALRKFSQTLSTKEVKRFIDEAFSHFTIAWPSLALYHSALNIQNRYKYSVYDSLIIAAAKEAKCKILYSEDLHNHQKIGDLKIINPFKI